MSGIVSMYAYRSCPWHMFMHSRSKFRVYRYGMSLYICNYERGCEWTLLKIVFITDLNTYNSSLYHSPPPQASKRRYILLCTMTRVGHSPIHFGIDNWRPFVWGAVLLFIRYFLISRVRFLDIKKWISWYQEFDFLISRNRILDIKKSNSWYQEINIKK